MTVDLSTIDFDVLIDEYITGHYMGIADLVAKKFGGKTDMETIVSIEEALRTLVSQEDKDARKRRVIKRIRGTKYSSYEKWFESFTTLT